MDIAIGNLLVQGKFLNGETDIDLIKKESNENI